MLIPYYRDQIASVYHVSFKGLGVLYIQCIYRTCTVYTGTSDRYCTVSRYLIQLYSKYISFKARINHSALSKRGTTTRRTIARHALSCSLHRHHFGPVPARKRLPRTAEQVVQQPLPSPWCQRRWKSFVGAEDHTCDHNRRACGCLGMLSAGRTRGDRPTELCATTKRCKNRLLRCTE